MKTIFRHRVEITDGTGIIRHADGYLVSEVAIAAENERQIVVDVNGRFTVISKKKSKYDTSLDDESIGIDTRDRVWGNRVTYTLYSYKKKRASSIRKAIEAEINRKLGFFINGVDLSCINDDASVTKAGADQ